MERFSVATMLNLYREIPPRQPRGSLENKDRQLAIAKFIGYAKRGGFTYRQALKHCRELLG